MDLEWFKDVKGPRVYTSHLSPQAAPTEAS